MPKELDAVVLKAVAPNPDARYQSMAAFAAELRSVAAALNLDDSGATRRGEQDAVAATSMRGVVLTTAVILAAAGGVVWWTTRS